MAAQQETYNYTVIRQFAIMTIVWGVVGMLVGVYAAAELAWPWLNFDIPYSSVTHQRGDFCVWGQRVIRNFVLRGTAHLSHTVIL